MPAFSLRRYSRVAPYSPRFSHFLAPLALLLGGEAIARQVVLNEFFTSLYNVLPTVLLLLGGALCAMYGRIRELFLLLCVYIVYFLLDTHADYYRAHGRLLDDAALTFHLCSLLLPLLYGSSRFPGKAALIFRKKYSESRNP